jgi:hypothetical protein
MMITERKTASTEGKRRGGRESLRVRKWSFRSSWFKLKGKLKQKDV